VCTVGSVVTHPGIVTAVVGEAIMTLDQRHLDGPTLGKMYQEAKDASERIAKEEKITVEWKKLWTIQPFPFNQDLIEFGDAAIKEIAGQSLRLPSGPLHDAAEVCRTGIPTVMLFVQSLHGISHNKIEDTKEAHLLQSVQAMDRLASKTIQWIGG
jgi:N-carbamoyl-L-amino-acid hydrolase